MTPDQLAKSGTEHAEQRALFAWANMAYRHGVKAACDDVSYVKSGYALVSYANQPRIEQLKWLHAIHNQGHGDAIRGAKAKAEGVKAGVADLFLPVPMLLKPDDHFKVYHGLYIEMKRASGGTTSEEQMQFGYDIKVEGYAWRVCFGWKDARDCLLTYLGLT